MMSHVVAMKSAAEVGMSASFAESWTEVPPRRSSMKEDRAGVGAGLSHAADVELEVARVAVAEFVALLDQHDLVDQAPARGRAARHPGHVDAGQFALERLEQGHEVPDGEYVAGQERLYPGKAVQLAVDRVRDDLAAEGVDRLL